MTFDLEKARACAVFVEPKEAFLEALDEIERLWADAEQHERVIETCSKVIDQQAARIRELEAENVQLLAEISKAKDNLSDCWKLQDEQAARIKDLEDALVEERARWCSRENTGAQLSQAGDQFQKRCRRSARLQLQAEGKIGPDADAKPREGLYGKYRISKADGSPVDPNADYFVLRLDTDPVARRAAREYSYMTVDRKLALELQKRITRYNPKMMDCINLQFFGVEKPRVWQITEERKAAIDKGMRVLAWVDSIHPELEPDVCLEVLQAMLEEIKS